MKRKLVIGFGACLVVGMGVTPAHANPSKGPLATAAVVECSINLVHFPNPVKTNNGGANCDGLSNGVFGGLQANAPGGAVAGVAAASPTSISANYTEPCVQGALGFSNGIGNVGGLTVVNVTKGSSTFIGTGAASLPYSWTRVGAIAVITTGKLNPAVDAKSGAQSQLTWATGFAVDAVGGLGLGVLIPLGVPDEVNCPGSPLTVQIVAVLVGL